MRALIVTVILLNGGCLSDGALKVPTGWRPAVVEGGWRVAEPEEVGLRRASVEAAAARFASESHLTLGRAFLVIRDGALVLEMYVRPKYQRDDLQYVKSVTKSVTSLALGLAIDDGAIGGVSDPLLPYLGYEADGQPGPAVADFITMRAGLKWDNESTNERFLVDHPRDSVAFAVARGFTGRPGEIFAYNDGEAHLVGAAVQAAVGKRLDTYVAERLFGPMGITEWRWYRHRDDVPYGAFGLWLRPRDMARLGQLMVQGGAWGGQQLISRRWLEESVIPRVANDTDEAPVYARGYPYGYFWWLEPSRGAVIARGHGGQNIYIVPAERLVIVLTAEPFSSYEAWIQNDEVDAMLDLLLEGAEPLE